MLKNLTGIATAMALAMAIAVVAALIEAPSACAEVALLTAVDLQSGRGTPDAAIGDYSARLQ